MRKEWEPRHSPVLAQAVRDLADFDAKHPNNGSLSLVSLITLMNAFISAVHSGKEVYMGYCRL